MKKSNTFNAVFSRKYVLAFALALLGSSLFILNFKDKTAQITSSDAAQATTPTVVAPQQEQVTTAPEARATTPVKRVKSASAKPEMKLVDSHEQALYAEAKAESGNDEEAEEESRRQQKRNSYEEFLKREFEMTKDPLTGKVPRKAAFEALEAARNAKEFLLPQNARGANVNGKEALPTVTVTPRGPFNFGGRVRMVGVDRRDNNILVGGGASGAIMRSTNGGSSWGSVHPAGIQHTVNAVVQHPHRDSGDIWYIGTGEPNTSASATGGSYFGNGILKSTDNGVSWTAIAPTQGVLESYDNDFEAVSKIVIDSASGRIYAAVLDAIYVSENGGAGWVKMLGAANSSGGYTDIIKTGNGIYYAAVRGNGLWKSNVAAPAVETDWTKIAGTSAPNTLGTGFSRIILASSPNNPNLVYALYNATEFTCPNGAKSQARLERYNATPNTWTDLSNNVGNCAGIAGTKTIAPQGGYNLAMAVKPDDATLVYLGGTEIYRYNTTTNDYAFIGGDQGSPSGTNLHVDVHSLYFSDNTTLWSTNDGGVHKTNVTGAIAAAPQGFTWDRKTTGFNGYQFYRSDISPTNGATFVGGGAQDNANLIIPNGTTDGIELGGGDGAQHAIIAGTSNADFNVLSSTQNGDLARRTQAGLQGSITPTGQKGEFVTNFLLDKDNSEYLYFPSFNAYDENGSPKGTGRKLFRSRKASTLDNGDITGNPTTGYEELTGVQSAAGTIIKSLASSYNAAYSGAAYTASNANRKLYFATDNTLFRLNDPAFCAANTAPVTLNAPGAGGATISDIAVNPSNDNEVLLTYSNYNTVSIYHTTNGNSATPTWTAVEGDANAAVGKASVRSALIVRSGTQTLYFVGTSTGLYATDALAGGTTVWEKVGGTVDKINFSPCVSMRLRTSDNNFVVGTHGSGLFQLSVPVAVLPIQLTTFTGKAVDKTNVLSWETATETNNKGFDIERSTDGSRFEKIGFVAGNGTTSKTQSYTFEDNTPLSISYYRLKQWDNDGRFELSKVIQITQKSSTKLNVYPNPVSNILTVETDVKGEYQIVNLVGQTVLRGQTNAQNIDVSGLPQGTYFLQVGKEQMKFIKQ